MRGYLRHLRRVRRVRRLRQLVTYHKLPDMHVVRVWRLSFIFNTATWAGL